MDNPLLAALSSHLSHACIIQVRDVNNVFAPDGSVNPRPRPPRRSRNRSRRDMIRERTLEVTLHPQPRPDTPRPASIPTPPTTNPSMYDVVDRSFENVDVMDSNSMGGNMPPGGIEALTGPRPVPYFQPLTPHLNAFQSSTICYQNYLSQLNARVARRSGTNVETAECPGLPPSTRRALSDALPDWFSPEQREALPLRWRDDSGGRIVVCRFCPTFCNLGRDICPVCIMNLEGEVDFS